MEGTNDSEGPEEEYTFLLQGMKKQHAVGDEGRVRANYKHKQYTKQIKMEGCCFRK